MIDRVARIKSKGFNVNLAKDTDDGYSTDFSKIRVGLQTLDDAIISYGTFKKTNPRLGSKANVLKAIDNHDVEEMR